jgi:hypothetical protein
MKKLKPLITRNWRTKKEYDAYMLGVLDCMEAYERVEAPPVKWKRGALCKCMDRDCLNPHFDQRGLRK